ncbi:putative splicing factor 3 subunit [Trypanosoma conorhini]|uniref:Putative splicing factor 3 subunit n=1 Tax=Trypanosoma conorhini TaxID=83891 RepID=A0A422PQE7_9TRYP|nr:putative splicing factor 3 subunit [Trypanosoma conorhini]RNF19976.1 putative splicing factor 3 subunit [Trypanosoma conorhini]
MATEDDATPGIIAPGPELRAKIEKSAASLAKRDKRKAEEMMAKVLASPKREEFLYFEMTHVFYPFFLQRLNEYRAHPELIPTDEKKEQAQGTAAAAAVTATTTIKAGGIVRREGGTAARHDPKRDEALRQAEVEAQRYLEDPFPNRYSLDLLHGTINMPALTLSYMTCTAQYVAKYGERFLKEILGRYRNNAAFRFLLSEDVRHSVFLKLVESYRLILNYDPDEVEDRLERYRSAQEILNTICEEKVKYAKAAIARRKAALLTDEELRDRLEWNVFTVVQQFSLSDLGLDGPMPQSAAAHRRQLPEVANGGSTLEAPTLSTAAAAAAPMSEVPAGPPRMLRPPEGVMAPPTFTPTFISSSLVTSTDPTAPLARRKRGHDEVDARHSPRGGDSASAPRDRRGYEEARGNDPAKRSRV